ncbi:hypothetical protein GCM10010303_22710 [Streptomyces purpurascens]|nr:hypothetical protein GCM10010303_22710 [Streptomyces purpurascens]
MVPVPVEPDPQAVALVATARAVRAAAVSRRRLEKLFIAGSFVSGMRVPRRGLLKVGTPNGTAERSGM